MTSPDDIRNAVKEVYNADVQAIKNLADVANTLLSPDKKQLNLPFDRVNITGTLTATGNVEAGQHLKVKDTFLAKGSGAYIRLLSDPANEGSYNCNLAIDNLWTRGSTTIGGALNTTGGATVESLHFRGSPTKRHFAFITDNNKLYLVPTKENDGKGGWDWNSIFGFNNNGNLTVNNDINGRNITTSGSLSVNTNASFGNSSGRPLQIISSNSGSEQTYLSFHNGGTRTGYIMPQTNGNLQFVPQNEDKLVTIYGNLNATRSIETRNHIRGGRLYTGRDGPWKEAW